MEPRVGVGLARIGREADAARRREVVAFGFGFGGGSDEEADDAIPRIDDMTEGKGRRKSLANTNIYRTRETHQIKGGNEISPTPKNECIATNGLLSDEHIVAAHVIDNADSAETNG